MSAAVGLFQGVCGLILILTTNMLVNKFDKALYFRRRTAVKRYIKIPLRRVVTLAFIPICALCLIPLWTLIVASLFSGQRYYKIRISVMAENVLPWRV